MQTINPSFSQLKNFVFDEEGAPNLDDMGADDLKSFAVTVYSRRMYAAESMFPDLDKPEALNAALALAEYAWRKLSAMQLRALGSVADALNYERQCDAIYSKLPDAAKW